MTDTTRMAFRAQIKLPYPATIFGITLNGLQPLSMIRNRLHVLDRSVLGKLRSTGRREPDQYWISTLNAPEITINPIFAATEGSSQRIPTREEFVQEYFKAEAVVKEHLPRAALIPHTQKTVSDSYALVEDICERRGRETEFLREAAPLVVQRVSAARLLETEKRILSLAQGHGITGGSLSLLAVLSCLYESESGAPAPGRGVLKPKTLYTARMAHNCLSDLLALELMIALASLLLEDGAFISADKNLGRFWQALGATATQPLKGKATGRFRVSAKLLHRIDDNGLERLEKLLRP